MTQHNKSSNWIKIVKVLNFLGIFFFLIGALMLYIQKNTVYSISVIGIGSALMIPDGCLFYKERTMQNPRDSLFWIVELGGLIIASIACNIYTLLVILKYIKH